jgi:hypothetical protein
VRVLDCVCVLTKNSLHYTSRRHRLAQVVTIPAVLVLEVVVCQVYFAVSGHISFVIITYLNLPLVTHSAFVSSRQIVLGRKHQKELCCLHLPTVPSVKRYLVLLSVWIFNVTSFISVIILGKDM